jgi:hypothetical protein
MTYSTQTTDQADDTQAISDRIARYNSNRFAEAQRDTMSYDIRAAVVAAQPSSVDE